MICKYFKAIARNGKYFDTFCKMVRQLQLSDFKGTSDVFLGFEINKLKICLFACLFFFSFWVKLSAIGTFNGPMCACAFVFNCLSN